MARKTPDYTKQARQKRRKQRETLPAPPSRAYASAVYFSLAGGAALFLYGCVLVFPVLSEGGQNARGATMAAIGLAAGIVATVLIGLLARYSFDPRAHPLRFNIKYLIYVIVFAGMISIMVVLSYKSLQLLMGPALIPAVAVFFFVVRPRLKAIAVAEGRYTKSRSEQKREQWERERQQEREEKRRYERLKDQRLSKPSRRVARKGTTGR